MNVVKIFWKCKLHFMKIKDIGESKNCSKWNKNAWNMPISTSHVLQENIKTDQASVHKTVSKSKNIKLTVGQKQKEAGDANIQIKAKNFS